MIIFATLGFDERFLVRYLLQTGIKENTKIILFSSGEEPRVEKAFNSIKSFVKALNVVVEKVIVDLKDTYYSISQIREIIQKNYDKEMIFNLSGGQRILIAYILSVISSLRIKAKIVMISEDFTYTVEIPSEVFHEISLDSYERDILRFIKERSYVKPGEVVKGLEISRTTFWRKVNRLVQLGLVEYKDKRYCLTNLGYTKAWKFNF